MGTKSDILMKEFELLKRTYPVSQRKRICDGYDYIMKNSTPEQRQEWGIDAEKLQQEIRTGERYIYEVAKESYKVFKVKYVCFSNFAIIRKHIFGIDED